MTGARVSLPWPTFDLPGHMLIFLTVSSRNLLHLWQNVQALWLYQNCRHGYGSLNGHDCFPQYWWLGNTSCHFLDVFLNFVLHTVKSPGQTTFKCICKVWVIQKKHIFLDVIIRKEWNVTDFNMNFIASSFQWWTTVFPASINLLLWHKVDIRILQCHKMVNFCDNFGNCWWPKIWKFMEKLSFSTPW